MRPFIILCKRNTINDCELYTSDAKFALDTYIHRVYNLLPQYTLNILRLNFDVESLLPLMSSFPECASTKITVSKYFDRRIYILVV